jgi:hypothetical protein
MNKKIIYILVLVLLTSLVLKADRKQQELFTKAITEKDATLKMQYLKDYQTKYGEKKDRFHKFLYLNLTDTAFRLKLYDEAISYGEKTLAIPELGDDNKIRLYMSLANSYNITKKDIEKASEYAQLTIDLAHDMMGKIKALDQDQESKDKILNNYNVFYIAPAYRIQSQILYNKGKDDPQTLKEAFEKACEAYRTDKSDRSAKMVSSFAMNLYGKKMNNEAIKALELIMNKENPDLKHIMMLGNLYYRLRNKKQAVHYFEMYYKIRKQAKIANRIGLLVQKDDPVKGANYFAEAFLLSKSNKESDAYKYLEHIYFNIIAKDKPPEEKEAGFKDFINQAKERLGLDTSTPM